jgi:hypothetical protein
MNGVKYFCLALSSMLLMNYGAHGAEAKFEVNTKEDGSPFIVTRLDIREHCLAILSWVDEVRFYVEGHTQSGMPRVFCMGRTETAMYGPSPVNFHSVCQSETAGELPIARPYYGRVRCDYVNSR